MPINRFHQNHKNWYWFLIFFVNILIPFAIAFARVAEDANEIDEDAIRYASFGLSVAFMFMAVVYVWATFREHRACLGLMKRRVARLHFNNFLIGISCTFVSLFFSFLITFFSINSHSQKWCKVLGYLVMALSMGLGLVSNVFLNMFEFRIGFEVFRGKYGNTLMKEIVNSINERKGIGENRGGYARYR